MLTGPLPANVKVGTNTPSAKLVVARSEPDVPVIVTVLVPVAALLPAVSVSVLDPVAGSGVSDAVTPLGRPETERFTEPENPYSGVMKTGTVVVVPFPMFTGPDANSVKAAARTLTFNVVVADRLPDVPVTVSVLEPSGVVLLAVSVRML
jgi:hypothetical protein